MRLVVVWVVIFTLPINGVSDVLLRVLGPQHHHKVTNADQPAAEGQTAWSIRSMVESVIGLQAMAIVDEVHARQHKGVFSTQAAHSHDGLQRHRHDPKDGSVIPIGPSESGHDASGASFAGMSLGGALPIPTAAVLLARLSVAEQEVWGLVHPLPWRSHVSAPMERPPRL